MRTRRTAHVRDARLSFFFASQVILPFLPLSRSPPPWRTSVLRLDMDWKKRDYLEKMEDELDLDGDGELEKVSLRDIDEVPDDAEPITFDDFMALMEESMGGQAAAGGGEIEMSAEERARAEKSDGVRRWREARKLADVNALFRP